MECVVFGSEGFIGSHLVDRLTASGHQVTAFDKRTNPLLPRRDEVRYVQGDFSRTADVATVLDGQDVVFHLVGTTVPGTSNADISRDVSSNVIGSIRFLQQCVEARIDRVVFLSSGGTVYGVPQITPIPESHPTNPICSYGITKLMVEKYLRLFLHRNGLDYRILRCANAYGERQDPDGAQGAIAVFMGRLWHGTPIVLWGTGEVVRDYVHVSDVTRALELASRTNGAERVFNIGGGVGTSLLQLLEELVEVTGRQTEVRFQPPRGIDVPSNVLDIRLAERSLDWTPQVDLPSGLARTWQWVQHWAAKQG
jgi:UDP-glucose 4-epimerase